MTMQTSGRITRQNLDAMKANADIKPAPISFLKKMAEATMSETVGFFHQLSAVAAATNNPCRDGHIAPLTRRVGQPVKCVNCQCEITAAYQIRSGLSESCSAKPIKAKASCVNNNKWKQRRLDLMPVR
jgi:hypothetical protein